MKESRKLKGGYFAVATSHFKWSHKEFWGGTFAEYKAAYRYHFPDEESECMPIDKLEELKKKYPDGN